MRQIGHPADVRWDHVGDHARMRCDDPAGPRFSAGRIVVVGGGIGGLTFAIAAARHRLPYEVEVIEGRTQRAAGAGAAAIGLHPIALRSLDSIGVGDAVRAAGIELDGYYARVEGRDKLIQPYTEVWGAPALSVHRADLAEILLGAAPDGAVSFGAAATDVMARADRVEVHLGDGSTRSADLVVGADGVRSRVRSQTLGGPSTLFGGAVFWRTTLPRRIIERATTFRLAADTTLGLLPVHGDRTHFFLQRRVTAPVGDSTEGRRERLQRMLTCDEPSVLAARALLPLDFQIHYGVLEWITPPAWGAGRVVLIGDAAHAMAPTLALGGAMAIEDAVVLAEELAAPGGDGVEAVVVNFSERRRERVEFVQLRTDLTFRRYGGEEIPGEPTDVVAFYRRNYEPLLAPP